ncbi:MAG: hypothetical protein ACMUIE_05405 [Thermoplasmatota archaeon]
MRKLALTLAITALLLNAGYFALYPPVTQEEGNGTGDGDGKGDQGDEITSDITTVTVPEMKIGDRALYDYRLFAELYWENKTSGEYGKYTFRGDGTLLQFLDEPVDAYDGFLQSHRSIKVSLETAANFEVRVEGSDRDPAQIDGRLDLKRSEFTNIFDKHTIKALNTGSITIEGLSSLLSDQDRRDNPDLGGLDDLTYNANLKTFPDPREDPLVSLDDAIYARGQTLSLQSTGTFLGEPIWGQDLYYNWSVVGAYKVADYDALKVNVTADLFRFLYFERDFYVTSDYPFPIKGHTRTNSSFEGDEEKFYIILETWQQIKEDAGSVVRGDKDIPWGDPTGHSEYVDLHPAGEFERPAYGPQDGSDLDRSSFNGLTLNNAVDYAKENSPDLRNFLLEYESRGLVLVEESTWNTSSDSSLLESKGTVNRWNITFSYVFDRDELIEYWEENDEWPEWRYRILVTRISTDEGSEIFIEKDEGDDYHGRRRTGWDGGIMEDNLDLNSKILTLTHAEKILRTDDDAKREAFVNNKLSEDTVFYFGVVGVNQENNQGLLLISQLTGIQTPSADNAMGIKSDTVWNSGTTFGAAVDANTGQLLYTNSIEGSALAQFFG